MKTNTLKIMAAAGLLAASSNSNAITLYPRTVMQDQDLETIVKGTNTGGTATQLNVGDSLFGVVSFDSVYSQPAGSQQDFGGANPTELTGIYQAEVLTKTDNGDGTFDYTFGASSSFASTYGLAAGTILAIFHDLTPNFSAGSCLDVAGCVANAIDGGLYLTLGDDNTASSRFQWNADNVASDDVANFLLGNSTTPMGNFGFAFDVLVNNTGYQIGPTPISLFECQNLMKLTDCSVAARNPDVYGSGTVKGGAGYEGTGWYATSNFAINLTTTIPEPSTIALLGLGLLGAGMNARKKQA